MTSNIEGVHHGNPQDNIIKISLISIRDVCFYKNRILHLQHREFQKFTGYTLDNSEQEPHSKELPFSLWTMMNIILKRKKILFMILLSKS